MGIRIDWVFVYVVQMDLVGAGRKGLGLVWASKLSWDCVGGVLCGWSKFYVISVRGIEIDVVFV